MEFLLIVGGGLMLLVILGVAANVVDAVDARRRANGR